MRYKRSLVVWAGLLMLGFILLARTDVIGAPKDGTSVHAVRTDVSPRLDGKLDDACWQKAVPVSSFLGFSGDIAASKTSVAVLYDNKNLYIGVICKTPDTAKIRANYRGGREGDIFSDDTIEVMIDPRTGGKEYLQVAINAAGAYFDAWRSLYGKKYNVGWGGDWNAASSIGEGQWSTEIKMPFALLPAKKTAGAPWKINVCRHTSKPSEYSSLAANGSFNEPDKFAVLRGLGEIKMASKKPVVFRVRKPVLEINLRDGKMCCMVRAVVTNTSTVAGNAVVRLEQIENNKRVIVSSSEIHMAGSESKEVVLDSSVELVPVEGNKSLLQPDKSLKVVVAGKDSMQAYNEQSISVFVKIPVQISVIDQVKPELKCISAFSRDGAGNKAGKILITIENADGHGKILTSREYQLTGGEIKADFQADKLPTGRLLARACVKNADGKTVLARDVTFVHLSKEPERLNNLVCRLEKGKLKLKKNRTKEIVFENPRDGWVWMKLGAVLKGEGEVTINKDECEWFKISASEEKETMRWVKCGIHRLTVSAAVNGKIDYEIKSVPELVFSSYNYSPIQKSSQKGSIYRGMKFGPYDKNYLRKNGILKNINGMMDNYSHKDLAFAKEWIKNGGRWFLNLTVPFKSGNYFVRDVTAEDVYKVWSKNWQLIRNNAVLAGYFLDEFVTYGTSAKMRPYAGAMRLMLEDKRFKDMMIYPYLAGGYASNTNYVKFLAEIYELGVKPSFHWYPPEESTPENFGKQLDKFRNRMAGHETKFPGILKQSQFTFCFGNLPGFPMADIHPDVDYKVHLDLHIYMLANDPLFKDLGGIQWYTSGYTDDETVRWCSALFRHYAIDGRRDKLSDRCGFKYNLTHIVNGDFDKGDNGLEGWKTKPAREGNMAVKRMMISDFGWRMQSRKVAYERRGKNIGNNVLWMKRSLAGPNLASQTIHGLKPGRLYSLKMISGDYGDLMAGKSVITKHVLRAIVENVEIIPSESFVGAWSSSGYKVERFNNKDPYWWNYHYMVFRAKGNQAKLTISDWADEKNPGGPEGQEQICNFIQIQPYFEKVEKINF